MGDKTSDGFDSGQAQINPIVSLVPKAVAFRLLNGYAYVGSKIILNTSKYQNISRNRLVKHDDTRCEKLINTQVTEGHSPSSACFCSTVTFMTSES